MIIYRISDIVVAISLAALFTSILINFVEANKTAVKKEKKSIVETGTMTLFFIGFYLLIKLQIGAFRVKYLIDVIMIISGLIMITGGAIINIVARFSLGKNWANQIKVYNEHTVVRTGFYGIVRHPLYSSLIMMFYGAAISYKNYYAFIANTVVFLPFMIFRARQEEKLLSEALPEYIDYKKEVGMLFPKLKK